MGWTYQTRIDEFDLGEWGRCRFGNWLHPQEGRKDFTESQIDWLAQFISPGDSCVDIGAYTGDTALPMAVAAGANGEVVAWEPNPMTYAILFENSKLNPQFAPIKCRNKAIGVDKGTSTFYYDKTSMNGGLLVREEQPVKVRVERLDAFKFKGRVAYAKIDTEGQDGELLSEYADFFRKNRTVVQVERYPYLSVDQCGKLWESIVSYGMPFIEHDQDKTPLARLPANLINIVIRPHAECDVG